MKTETKLRLAEGIVVMSNPFSVLIVIVTMLLLGWFKVGDLSPILFSISGAYLILSVIGGQLVKKANNTP